MDVVDTASTPPPQQAPDIHHVRKHPRNLGVDSNVMIVLVRVTTVDGTLHT